MQVQTPVECASFNRIVIVEFFDTSSVSYTRRRDHLAMPPRNLGQPGRLAPGKKQPEMQCRSRCPERARPSPNRQATNRGETVDSRHGQAQKLPMRIPPSGNEECAGARLVLWMSSLGSRVSVRSCSSRPKPETQERSRPPRNRSRTSQEASPISRSGSEASRCSHGRLLPASSQHATGSKPLRKIVSAAPQPSGQ